MDKLKSIYASAYSAAITIAAIVAMTIGAELSASFKNLLTALTGHHWISKSLISILVFILFFGVIQYSRKSVNESRTRKALSVLVIFTIVGFLAILGFYVYEFLALRPIIATIRNFVIIIQEEGR